MRAAARPGLARRGLLHDGPSGTKGMPHGRRRPRPARRGRPVVDPEHRPGRGGEAAGGDAGRGSRRRRRGRRAVPRAAAVAARPHRGRRPADHRSHGWISEKRAGRLQPGGAGVRPAVAAGQTSRRPGVARPAVPARQDRLLALPGRAHPVQLAHHRLPGGAGEPGCVSARRDNGPVQHSRDIADRLRPDRERRSDLDRPRRTAGAGGENSDIGPPHRAKPDARAGPAAVLPGVQRAGPA